MLAKIGWKKWQKRHKKCRQSLKRYHVIIPLLFAINRGTIVNCLFSLWVGEKAAQTIYSGPFSQE